MAQLYPLHKRPKIGDTVFVQRTVGGQWRREGENYIHAVEIWYEPVKVIGIQSSGYDWYADLLKVEWVSGITHLYMANDVYTETVELIEAQ